VSCSKSKSRNNTRVEITLGGGGAAAASPKRTRAFWECEVAWAEIIGSVEGTEADGREQ
jgi:hypothetical protein